jgi:hypothetical protein
MDLGTLSDRFCVSAAAADVRPFAFDLGSEAGPVDETW